MDSGRANSCFCASTLSCWGHVPSQTAPSPSSCAARQMFCAAMAPSITQYACAGGKERCRSPQTRMPAAALRSGSAGRPLASAICASFSGSVTTTNDQSLALTQLGPLMAACSSWCSFSFSIGLSVNLRQLRRVRRASSVSIANASCVGFIFPAA